MGCTSTSPNYPHKSTIFTLYLFLLHKKIFYCRQPKPRIK